MHIVLLRHGSRIDKPKNGPSPNQSRANLATDITSDWLSNFDPPLNANEAHIEMERAFKKLQSDLTSSKGPTSIMVHSSPYNRCIQTSELLVDSITKSKNFKIDNKPPNIKLRVDQALSEWLNENYNLNYLPPNDDGYSMINNVNAYLNQPENSLMNNEFLNDETRVKLKSKKDQMWSYNQLGHCGDYGESPENFTRRCFNYLIYLLQYYYIKQEPEKDKQTVVFIVSHGAVISTILQILLGRSIFNEVPLCTPIYFKQSDKRRSIFKLRDYDFNLNKLLNIEDQEFYKILERPIDMTKLDPDNLTSELTIGTTGYTTIIQSIPNKKKKKTSSTKLNRRKRRNTFDLANKEENEEQVNIKQTRSSQQLYLLNKDTSDEKVIDLNKLHSYFGGDSDSDSDITSSSTSSDDELDYDRKDNVFRGRISSLSSFNEENKNKFLLNKSNFFSKDEIAHNPYSHFFINGKSFDDNNINDYKNKNNDDNNNNDNNNNDNFNRKEYDNSAKLFQRFGTNESLKDLIPKSVHSAIIHTYNPSEITDDEDETDFSDFEDVDKENGILSFGKRSNISDLLAAREKMVTDEDIITPILKGTFSKKTLGSHTSFTNLLQPQETPPSPKLISSSNKNLPLRSTTEVFALSKSKEDLQRILLATANESESDEEPDGWFGGFSR